MSTKTVNVSSLQSYKFYEISNLKRRQLQTLAKANGIKANSKNIKLVKDLQKKWQEIENKSTNSNREKVKTRSPKPIQKSVKSSNNISEIEPSSQKQSQTAPETDIEMQIFSSNDNDYNAIDSKYETIKVLGSGAFGTVKLVRNRQSKDEFALKEINRRSWQRLKHATNRTVSLLDEVKIMRKADHPGIVKVIEVFEEETKVNVILEFCQGGSMLEFIQKNGTYSSDEARHLFKQLVSIVEYLHSLKIAHRDLKPENILLTDENGETLKLIDFGISREQTSSGCGTVIGTPMYQAPEVHNCRVGYDGAVADYWALGVVLYVMLVAAPPISANENAGKICEMSKKRSLPWYDEPVPETAKDLIYRLLCVDPNKRITAKDIYKHEWMSNEKESNGSDSEMKETEERDECSSNDNQNSNGNGGQHRISAPGMIGLRTGPATAPGGYVNGDGDGSWGGHGNVNSVPSASQRVPNQTSANRNMSLSPNPPPFAPRHLRSRYQYHPSLQPPFPAGRINNINPHISGGIGNMGYAANQTVNHNHFHSPESPQRTFQPTPSPQQSAAYRREENDRQRRWRAAQRREDWVNKYWK